MAISMRAAGAALLCSSMTIGVANAAGAAESVAAAAMTAPVTATAALPSYRAIGAQHLYGSFAQRIFKGKLPPLLYAIAIVDTEVDEDGNVVNAVITREPAVAKEVMPWIIGLIRQASPFPKPGVAGHTTYHDIWLVDHSYMFQLDTLTEGQE
jgi:hypothetical protein